MINHHSISKWLEPNLGRPIKSKKKDSNLVICLVIGFVLLLVQFVLSQVSHSLLLFNVGIFQLSLSIFFLPLIIKNQNQRQKVKFRWVTRFFHGFLILILTGYLFNQVFLRIVEPQTIFSLTAGIGAVVGFLGNIAILTVLLHKEESCQFQAHFKQIALMCIGVFFTIAIIYFTKLVHLDTLLSMILGLPIFCWAFFLMLDAYWHIEEIK